MRVSIVFLITAFAATPILRAADSEMPTTPQVQDVLAAGWRDGEIRTETIPGSRDTEVSLALLPSGPQGTLILVLTARSAPQRLPSGVPTTLQVRIGAGLNVNPKAIRRPVLRFILDPNRRNVTTIDASNRLRFHDPDPSASLENAAAIITLAEFVDLVRANAIAAQMLGLDVSFTAKQLDALRAFGMRVLGPVR